MKTDITELAQSLKRRAASANEFGESLYVKGADVIALVEALEKAQGMEAYWKTQCRGITDHCEELQARIEELESQRKLAFTASNRWADKFRESEKRIAELESRTVTVKLPDFRHEHFNSNWGEHDAEAYQVALREALTAASIKWEAE